MGCWPIALFLSKPIPIRSDFGALPDWEHLRSDKGCSVLYFGNGTARVFFVRGSESDTRGDRKRIMDQSTASRLRAAWTFKAARCTWLAFSTLTWRFNPEKGFFHPTKKEVMRAADYLRRGFKARWGEPVDAWMMECHKSGVPHFHLFHAAESNFGVACASADSEVKEFHGIPREVVRGGPHWWLMDTWLKATRRKEDAASRSFMNYGIIQYFDNPHGACRYVAKEAAKRYQKELPAEYPEGLGQWWWLNPKWKPRVRWIQHATLERWPYEHPMSYLFEAEEVGCNLTGEIIDVGNEGPNLATWESWARM